MIHTENRLEPKDVTIDVTCDSCQQSCKKNTFKDDNGHEEYVFEYMTLSAHWGYFSVDKDLTKYTAHICENCVDTKFSFIKFNKENYYTK